MKTFFYQLAQNPKEFLIKICQENALSYAFLGYALGVVSLYFAIKLNSFEQTSFFSFIAIFIFWFLINILANLILASISNLLLDLLGYKSRAVGIFMLLGISQLVLTLLVPCFLITNAFPTIAILTPLAVLAILFIYLYAVLSAMKNTFETSKAVSLVAFMISCALPFIASFCFIIFVITFIVALAH